MSKMTNPAVDVVRFSESDVIVASLVLGNYSDNKTSDDGVGNGFIKYGGHTYYTAGGDDTYRLLSEALAGRDYLTVTSTGLSENMETVFYFENSDKSGEVTSNDGTYRWNGSSWIWSHQ